MNRIVKFVLVGLIGLSINLGSYHLAIASFHLPLLLGSIIAVSLATCVTFVLQKFWTFEARGGSATRQFALYGLVSALNIGLNTLIVDVLLQFDVYYLLAQTIAAGLVAVWSFLFYRSYIFRHQAAVLSSEAP